MASHVVLVRHGQTEWTITGQHTGRSDIPLTDLGRQQALALKAMLDGYNFAEVFVSPFSRAKETAELAGMGSVDVDEDLAEWDYGVYESRRTRDIRQEIPMWSVWTHEIIHGESVAQLGARCDRMIARTEKVEGQVALFGHGHALRVLGARWMGLPPTSGANLVLETAYIFTAAGLGKPNISILSDEFLAEVRGLPQRNLAVELLQKLLMGEIKARRRKNVQARSFAELLEQVIRRYQNRALEAAQVIDELFRLAKEIREADARGEALGLTEEEIAFYDALETNDSAVKVLGEPTLRLIARELVKAVRLNVSIDWTLRENVRAHLRVIVKRILRQHGYPPDKAEKATQTVLEQAEVLSELLVTE